MPLVEDETSLVEADGVTWPAMQAMTVRWIPVQERPRFMSTVFMASTLGVVLTMPLCGYVISVAGWEAAFYVTGALSVVWAMFWWILVFDNPEDHPRIKLSELSYITESVRRSGTSAGGTVKVPWRQMLTSPPFWAIAAADCGNIFGYATFLTEYPQFLASTYSLNVKKSALISASPFLARYIGAASSGFVSDALVNKKGLSVIVVRKLFSSIAMLLPAAFIFLIVLLMEHMKLVLVLVCCCMFFNGSISSSILVNGTDIAPNYAGTMFGVINTLGSSVASLAPLLTGLVNTHKTMNEWRYVFLMSIPFYVVTEIVYLLFASGSVASWNYEFTQERNSTQPNTSNTQPDCESDVDEYVKLL